MLPLLSWRPSSRNRALTFWDANIASNATLGL